MATSTYNDKQLLFIMNKRIEGLTFEEIAAEFNNKYTEDKSSSQIADTFRRHKHNYDLPEFDKHPDKVRKEKMDEIMDNFLEFIRNNKYVPTMQDMISLGFVSYSINNYFNGLNGLEQQARAEFPSVFSKVIDEHAFTEDEFGKLQKEVCRYDRFVITSAVTGCEVHEQSLESIKNYCKRNKAKLLVLPCSDPASNRKNKWSLDHRLQKASIVFKDLNLNSKFLLSTIKLSAKHINPATGMARFGQRSGSFVYASPKQSLEYVANSASKKIPRAIMTTGAITKPQYQTEAYMSERTAYIAHHDHVIGAIIVEIKDDKIFFFRQVQMEPKTGAFIDLDTKYFADGRTKKVTAALVQFGDYHVGDTDPLAKKVGKELCDLVQPEFVTVEDFLNGHSINHHEEGRPLTLAMKVEKAFHVLDAELKANADELKEIMSWGNHKQLIVKYGNHEDFLFRYLDNMSFVKDKVNYKRAINLSDAVLNQGWANPFEYAMRVAFEIGDSNGIRFLQDADESFVVGGIENGVHGHLGANGSRSPGLAGLEKCYGACNAGHTHSAGILRRVFRVGTTSYLKVSYNKGPSSWTNTHLIQHENGSRQLINCIDGKWRLES